MGETQTLLQTTGHKELLGTATGTWTDTAHIQAPQLRLPVGSGGRRLGFGVWVLTGRLTGFLALSLRLSPLNLVLLGKQG